MRQKGLNLNKVIFYLLILFLLFLIIHYMKIAFNINENLEVPNQAAKAKMRHGEDWLKKHAIGVPRLWQDYKYITEKNGGDFGWMRRYSNHNAGVGQYRNAAEKNIPGIKAKVKPEQDSLVATQNSYKDKQKREDSIRKTIDGKKKQLNNLPKPTVISLKHQGN